MFKVFGIFNSIELLRLLRILLLAVYFLLLLIVRCNCIMYKFMEARGIEPLYPACKASALPLS
jgi:hypothetical protein